MRTEQYIINFYSNYDEDGRLASRHGAVEFLTTMRYIEKYAGPGARVLEVGAGTGRYSHALARRGYAVDAVELVAHNIEVFRRNTQPGEAVTITQGNALNLSAFADGTYDMKRRISGRPCARPSASQSRAGSSSPHTSYRTAAFWTKDSAAAASMWRNM